MSLRGDTKQTCLMAREIKRSLPDILQALKDNGEVITVFKDNKKPVLYTKCTKPVNMETTEEANKCYHHRDRSLDNLYQKMYQKGFLIQDNNKDSAEKIMNMKGFPTKSELQELFKISPNAIKSGKSLKDKLKSGELKPSKITSKEFNTSSKSKSKLKSKEKQTKQTKATTQAKQSKLCEQSEPSEPSLISTLDEHIGETYGELDDELEIKTIKLENNFPNKEISYWLDYNTMKVYLETVETKKGETKESYSYRGIAVPVEKNQPYSFRVSVNIPNLDGHYAVVKSIKKEDKRYWKDVLTKKIYSKKKGRLVQYVKEQKLANK